MDIKEKIEVMQAYLDGQDIEFKWKNHSIWSSPAACIDPQWNWVDYDYRIKQSGPVINWDHVSDDYNYLAQDMNGHCYVFKNKPFLDENGCWMCFGSACADAKSLKSLIKGNDYKILTVRPGLE